jgi:DNA-binding IclR family transcriptional regulator
MSSSAQRALRILEAIGVADRPLGVTELGRNLAIPAGTAFRSLDALERGGLVSRFQSSPRYVLGPTLNRLRHTLFAQFPIRDVCTPYLRQLAFASGETTSLTVAVGWYGVRIAAAPGVNEVTSSPPLGVAGTLATGGACRAILAFLADGSAARMATWAQKHALPIRQRGFAVEAAPFAARRASIALPIRAGGGTHAAIAIEGPVLDLDNPRYHDDLGRWTEIVAAIEDLARIHPALFADPFGHLERDTVVFDDIR